MDTEEGQMMSFLWDMLEEGEYSDASILARQMLQDNPNNKEAISVLAIVYERMADASRDGGDEENEREFLKSSLSQYLKLLSIDPDSVAEKIKVSKIKKRLNNETDNEFNNEFIKNKWDELKEKYIIFYDEKLSKWVEKKWFKPVSVSACVLVIAIIAICSTNAYYKQKEAEIEAQNNSSFLQGTLNSDFQTGDYKGPTDTILIENNNAKAEREEKAIEEQVNKQLEEKKKEEAISARSSSLRGVKRNNIENNTVQNQNIAKGVKALKLPFSNIELKQVEKDNEEKIETSNKTENIETTEKVEEPKAQEIKKTNPNMRRADALVKKSVREYGLGNIEEAKRSASQAKNIYINELDNGNTSKRIRTNIETCDTILGK